MPLPFSIPETVVLSVIAGLVPGVMVASNPFVATTERPVKLPPPEAHDPHVGICVPEVEMRHSSLPPSAVTWIALEPLP